MSVRDEIRDIKNRLWILAKPTHEGLTRQDLQERLNVLQMAIGVLGNRLSALEDSIISEPMQISETFSLRHRTMDDLLRTLASQQMEIEPLIALLAWHQRSRPKKTAPTHKEIRRHWERGHGSDECWFTAEDSIGRRTFIQAWWHPAWTGDWRDRRFATNGYDIDPVDYSQWIACSDLGEPQPWPSDDIDPIPDPAPGFCMMADRYVEVLKRFGM